MYIHVHVYTSLRPSQRFISPKHHSPACTSYNDPRSALSLSGGGRAGGRAPFGQSSLRFRSNRLAREIPGTCTCTHVVTCTLYLYMYIYITAYCFFLLSAVSSFTISLSFPNASVIYTLFSMYMCSTLFVVHVHNVHVYSESL